MSRMPNPNVFLKRLAEDSTAPEKNRLQALCDLDRDAPLALLLRLLRAADTPASLKTKAIELYDLEVARRQEKKPNVTVEAPQKNNQ